MANAGTAVVEHRERSLGMTLKTMNVETSLIRLRELAFAIPRPGCDWEERPQFDSPPTPEFVEAASVAAGGQLPDDLLTYFQLCGRVIGMSIHNGYELCSAADLVSKKYRRAVPPTLPGPSGPMPVVPIAWDGGGNAFVLSIPKGDVWRWDHETGVTRFVAPSFSHFLERVVADWEAYVADTPGWRFLV